MDEESNQRVNEEVVQRAILLENGDPLFDVTCARHDLHNHPANKRRARKMPADYQLLGTPGLDKACGIERAEWAIFLAAEPHGPIIERTMRVAENCDSIYNMESPGKPTATITGTFDRVVLRNHADYSRECKCWICKLVRRVCALGAGRVCIPDVGLMTAECLSEKPDTGLTPTASVVHAFAGVGMPVYLYTKDRGVRALHFRSYSAAIADAVPLIPSDANDALCEQTRGTIYHMMTCTPVDPGNAIDATGQDPNVCLPAGTPGMLYYPLPSLGCGKCADIAAALTIVDMRGIAGAYGGMPPIHARALMTAANCKAPLAPMSSDAASLWHTAKGLELARVLLGKKTPVDGNEMMRMAADDPPSEMRALTLNVLRDMRRNPMYI